MAAFLVCLLTACGHQESANNQSGYNDLQEPGIKTGGLKVIPIHTVSGNFKMWTQRFG
jgi:hypothetical protein